MQYQVLFQLHCSVPREGKKTRKAFLPYNTARKAMRIGHDQRFYLHLAAKQNQKRC